MDESAIFTKMADCPEIQVGHRPDEGDIYYVKNLRMNLMARWVKVAPYILTQTHRLKTVSPDYEPNHTQNVRDNTHIWLPYPHQSQEMSGLSWYLFDKACVTWATVSLEIQGESKEIVSLRVMMKEKHNKVWDGKEWIKDGN